MNLAFQMLDDAVAPEVPNPYPPERLIKRAGVDFMLTRLSTLYEVVLWRSSNSMDTLDKLDPTGEYVDYHLGPQRLVEGLKVSLLIHLLSIFQRRDRKKVLRKHEF